MKRVVNEISLGNANLANQAVGWPDPLKSAPDKYDATRRRARMEVPTRYNLTHPPGIDVRLDCFRFQEGGFQVSLTTVIISQAIVPITFKREMILKNGKHFVLLPHGVRGTIEIISWWQWSCSHMFIYNIASR